MLKKVFLFLSLILTILVFGETLESIIDKVEKNLSVKNVVYRAKMNIEESDNTREMDLLLYIKDEKNVYVEVLTSSDGNRSRFLKKDNSMWLYLPSAGRSVLIKGHMLKEGFMGSSFSYEDISERRRLKDIYDISLVEDEKFYIFEMKAKVNDAPYKYKKSYVRKDVYLPYKEEIYSSSNRLLKEFYIEEYEKIKDIYFPKKVVMKDLLQKKNITTIEYMDISIKDKLPENYFTKSYLER
ncbi:MAG: outer membrane lipoprotein-sorting protein [candidate division WOR-3 bacterium]